MCSVKQQLWHLKTALLTFSFDFNKYFFEISPEIYLHHIHHISLFCITSSLNTSVIFLFTLYLFKSYGSFTYLLFYSYCYQILIFYLLIFSLSILSQKDHNPTILIISQWHWRIFCYWCNRERLIDFNKDMPSAENLLCFFKPLVQ